MEGHDKVILEKVACRSTDTLGSYGYFGLTTDNTDKRRESCAKVACEFPLSNLPRFLVASRCVASRMQSEDAISDAIFFEIGCNRGCNPEPFWMQSRMQFRMQSRMQSHRW